MSPPRKRLSLAGRAGRLSGVCEALYEHLSGREPSEYVLFPRADRGRPMDPASVHRWWSRCLERAGIEHFPMHELRHSAAQALYDETGDPVLAQMLLRHSDLKTTRGYLHPTLDRLETALRGLDRHLVRS
jgi:integrase